MNIIEVDYKFNGKFDLREKTDTIVLHHAAAENASPETVHQWHLGNGWIGIGYHFYVRKDGTVYRGRPENTVGAHAVGENYTSIGICFEGNFESEHMGQAQSGAGRMLVRQLKEKYGISRILKHSDADATACPGKNFPFDWIAWEEGVDTEPSDWALDCAEWAADLGLFVGDGAGGFRWHEQVTREELAVILFRLTEVFDM